MTITLQPNPSWPLGLRIPGSVFSCADLQPTADLTTLRYPLVAPASCEAARFFGPGENFPHARGAQDYLRRFLQNSGSIQELASITRWTGLLPVGMQLSILQFNGFDGVMLFNQGSPFAHAAFQLRSNQLQIFSIEVELAQRDKGFGTNVVLSALEYARTRANIDSLSLPVEKHRAVSAIFRRIAARRTELGVTPTAVGHLKIADRMPREILTIPR